MSSKNTGPEFLVTEISVSFPQSDLLPMEFPLTLSAADSHARIFQRVEPDLGLMESEADFGENILDWFARYDQASSSWRTAQSCLMDGWAKWSGRWPRSGMIRNGSAFRRVPLVRLIDATASGLLPTPLASDCRDRGDCSMPSIQRRMRIGKQVGLSTLFKGTPCPSCVEGMMGFPRDWLRMNCTPSETL